MKSQTTLRISLWLGIVGIATAPDGRLEAQVINGDFSSGLTNWTVLQLPSNSVVGGSLTSVDIDGLPLGLSVAYYCQPGNNGGERALQQAVFLTEGTIYDFSADLAMESGSNNGDGGTVSAYIDSTLIASYAFGSVSWHVKKFATLSGTYVPAATGIATLTITFTRPWEAAPDTPYDYIDNIQLTAESCQFTCPSNMVIAAASGRCGAVMHFALPAPTGDCSNAVVTCTPPSGSFFPLGTSTVTCSIGGRHICNFTITVEDREAPRSGCRFVPRFPGEHLPQTMNDPWNRHPHEGFYQLLSKDNCDSNPALYVADSASSFIAGPFRNGNIVKIVQLTGEPPFSRPGTRGFAANLLFKGHALIFAVDSSGNVSPSIGCNAPRPPR